MSPQASASQTIVMGSTRAAVSHGVRASTSTPAPKTIPVANTKSTNTGARSGGRVSRSIQSICGTYTLPSPQSRTICPLFVQ